MAEVPTELIPRPTADALVITQRVRDGTRSLHFSTDRGQVVIRIEDPELLRTFGELICEEADSWEGAPWE